MITSKHIIYWVWEIILAFLIAGAVAFIFMTAIGNYQWSVFR